MTRSLFGAGGWHKGGNSYELCSAEIYFSINPQEGAVLSSILGLKLMSFGVGYCLLSSEGRWIPSVGHSLFLLLYWTVSVVVITESLLTSSFFCSDDLNSSSSCLLSYLLDLGASLGAKLTSQTKHKNYISGFWELIDTQFSWLMFLILEAGVSWQMWQLVSSKHNILTFLTISMQHKAFLIAIFILSKPHMTSLLQELGKQNMTISMQCYYKCYCCH